MQTLFSLQRALVSGAVKARALIEESLGRIENPSGEGSRAFLTVYADKARAEADLVDAARAKNLALPPFAGIPLAIKDLYDVAGETTRCASLVREGTPPAERDAETVAFMRRAGFIVVGKNNMSEFAYSGLGVNAHFPAPRSPYQREVGRVPGGSTSGGGSRSRTAWRPSRSAPTRAVHAGSPPPSAALSASSRRLRACRSAACSRSPKRSIRSARWRTASPAARSPIRS